MRISCLRVLQHRRAFYQAGPLVAACDQWGEEPREVEREEGYLVFCGRIESKGDYAERYNCQ